MRRGAVLIAFGVLASVLGLASARASGPGTTTTTTTTTTSTTTATTPSYAPLASSSLPTGCVGSGVAALVMSSHSVVALGTPASDLGPSAYPASASVIAFDWATVSGSTCSDATIALGSVSLFDGAVTATSIGATDGRGTANGLQIGGSPVSAAAGQTLPVADWGQLTLGETVGRLTAPLVVRLLQSRDGLPAGTSIAVAFAAAPQPATKPVKTHHPAPSAHSTKQQAKGASASDNHRQQPPPDFPATANPVLVGGRLSDTALDNPVVSTAVKYLGVPYEWGGASPTSGFDCSGLVMYVFAQLGVSLTHFAAAQWHTPDGVWVAPNRLQPGDLVFFVGSDGTRKAPGHVGIYAGDGYFIDAPHTGSFVRIDSLTASKFANQYVGARRIVSQLHARRSLEGHPLTASATAFHLGFASPVGPLNESFGLAAAGTAVARPVSRAPWVWLGLGLGVGLIVLLCAGAIVARRSRQPGDPIEG